MNLKPPGATYRAHPRIAIPSWLQGEGWQDTSWGNDACASSEHLLADGRVLRVWVDHEEPEEREMRGRFALIVYPDRDSVGNVEGATVIGEGIESEAEAYSLAQKVLSGE